MSALIDEHSCHNVRVGFRHFARVRFRYDSSRLFGRLGRESALNTAVVVRHRASQVAVADEDTPEAPWQKKSSLFGCGLQFAPTLHPVSLLNGPTPNPLHAGVLAQTTTCFFYVGLLS